VVVARVLDPRLLWFGCRRAVSVYSEVKTQVAHPLASFSAIDTVKMMVEVQVQVAGRADATVPLGRFTVAAAFDKN
jgi:hypothetical protein